MDRSNVVPIQRLQQNFAREGRVFILEAVAD